MTRVLIDLRRPDPDGTASAAGHVEWRPTRRRIVDEHVVLPVAFTVQLVDGQATVDLAPTDPDWCWRALEYVRGVPTARHVLVPDSAEPVPYAHLVEVDPATLEPTPEALEGWAATLAEVKRLRDEARALTTVTHHGDGIYKIGDTHD